MLNHAVLFLLKGLENKYNSGSFMRRSGILVKAAVRNCLNEHCKA